MSLDVGALYDTMAPAVHRYIERRMFRHPEAEDVVASVWERLTAKRDMYDDRGVPMSAWVYRVAGNVLVDHFRARKTQRLDAVRYFGALTPEQHPATTDDDPLKHADLYAAIEQLVPLQRRVICLRYLEGVSVRDTATVLGRTEEAIKKLAQRGLAQLKRILTSVPKPAVAEAPKPEPKDEVVELHAAGFTSKQIAESVGLSLRAVNRRLQKARARRVTNRD